MLEIREVDTTSQAEVDRFVDLPYRLYVNQSRWVPPLRETIADLLNKAEHPYYARCKADFLLAVRDGQDVARIALLEHCPYNQAHGVQEVWFCFFECEPEDTEAATALFEHAFALATARGLTNMVGPRGFAPLDSMGLLVEGFEYPQPMTMMDYTLVEYVSMFETNGFQKKRDIHSYYVSMNDFQLPTWIHRLADRIRQEGSLSIRHFVDMNDLLANAPLLMNSFQRSSERITGFAQTTEAELGAMLANVLKMGVNPHFVKGIVYHENPHSENPHSENPNSADEPKRSEGKIVGAIFGFPDLSSTLQQLQGTYDPTQLQAGIGSSTGMLINGFGILPDYQLQGSNALIYTEIEAAARDANMQTVNLLHVAESTARMQQDLAGIGLRPTQTHRLYERMIRE